MTSSSATGLPIKEAAAVTGWSSRMLRYLEQLGLVTPPRSDGGYRLYGGAELQRLRTLRELLDERGLSLTDIGVAVRLRHEPETRAAVDEWLDGAPVVPAELAGEPGEPGDPSAWLRFEQEKHLRLLAAIRPTSSPQDSHDRVNAIVTKESA